MVGKDHDDYDSPWKQAIEHHFPEFMAFYFPEAHAVIDWSRGHAFLDQELRQAVPDAETGKHYVDKLVQVARRDGGEEWVFIHVEVQSQTDAQFAERMFRYHYRLYDRHRQAIASLAVLADGRRNWRPASFAYQLFGCRIRLDFPAVKLLDHADRMDALLVQDNPFALVTAAHLLTQQTRQRPQARFDAKWRLSRLLYERQWQRQRILDLFQVIDWLMRLPPDLEQDFRDNIEQLEEEQGMRYITSIERLARAEGVQQGVLQGMQQGMQQGRRDEAQHLLTRQLARRFGPLPPVIEQRLAAADAEHLERWALDLLDAKSLDDIFAVHRRTDDGAGRV